MLRFLRIRRLTVLWFLRRCGIYHCIYCHVLTPYVGNNNAEGDVWCERCANDGLVADDARRAQKQEEWWAKMGCPNG